MGKTLVIYYSRKGQNYVNGSIKNLPKGNTEIVAEFIRDAVGSDLFEVKLRKPMRKIIVNAPKRQRKKLRIRYFLN